MFSQGTACCDRQLGLWSAYCYSFWLSSLSTRLGGFSLNLVRQNPPLRRSYSPTWPGPLPRRTGPYLAECAVPCPRPGLILGDGSSLFSPGALRVSPPLIPGASQSPVLACSLSQTQFPVAWNKTRQY